MFFYYYYLLTVICRVVLIKATKPFRRGVTPENIYIIIFCSLRCPTWNCQLSIITVINNWLFSYLMVTFTWMGDGLLCWRGKDDWLMKRPIHQNKWLGVKSFRAKLDEVRWILKMCIRYEWSNLFEQGIRGRLTMKP